MKTKNNELKETKISRRSTDLNFGNWLFLFFKQLIIKNYD